VIVFSQRTSNNYFLFKYQIGKWGTDRCTLDLELGAGFSRLFTCLGGFFIDPAPKFGYFALGREGGLIYKIYFAVLRQEDSPASRRKRNSSVELPMLGRFFCSCVSSPSSSWVHMNSCCSAANLLQRLGFGGFFEDHVATQSKMLQMIRRGNGGWEWGDTAGNQKYICRVAQSPAAEASLALAVSFPCANETKEMAWDVELQRRSL